MTRRAWAAGLAAVVVLLPACAPDQPVTATGATPAAGTPLPASGLDPAVVDARRAAGIADCPTADPQAAPVPGGLPEVALDCLGGDTRVRLSELRGPMIVNVWAQWCGPCRTEAPFLAEFATQHPEVQVVGIDYADPLPGAAVEFAAASGWTWPQVADPQRLVAADLQVIGPPQTVFVDASGRITHTHRGPFTSTDQIAGLAREHL